MSDSVRTVNASLLARSVRLRKPSGYAAAHDVVAELCQVASVHGSMMSHADGNVEPPYPFYSVRCLNRVHQRNTVVILGEPIRLVSVEVGRV